VLCANLRAKGEAQLLVQPHLLLQREGVKLGVFGVTVSMFGRKQWSQPLCDYWFEDPLATARQQVTELRSQVDLLIALTHIGFRQDLALAALCPELDLIIGGHSHTDLDAPHVEAGVPILQARSHGFFAGVAVLEAGCGLLSWEKKPLRDDRPTGKLP
jgi:2',3'-cyclic-nucleotide 2'-phosphodiesterase (5'-nucleotidase family)